MGIPDTITWAGVLTNIEELLSNGVVTAGVLCAVALKFGPRIMGAMMRSIKTR